MLIKKLALITLLAGVSTTNLQAASSHEIRTWGIMISGLIATSAGIHMLHRHQYDISHRVFDVVVGAALITAGLYGIVANEKAIKMLERAFKL